jgi:6-phosphogluconolactonase
MAAMLIVCEDVDALNREAAARFVRRSEDAVATRGRFTVALSGGSTPRSLYELLACAPWRKRIAWTATHVFWGDERCVPPDHRDSNYRMAYQALLAHVPIPVENVHRMRGEIEPSAAAEACEYDVRAAFDLAPGKPPRFDLILLGLGDDGHTASLFPGTVALIEQGHWVVANWVEKLNAYRLTLTPPVLNAAHEVIFLVAGAGKAGILSQVLHGERRPDRYPAQVVQPTQGILVWLVDRAAAAELGGTQPG